MGKTLSQQVFRIRQRNDGRFECRNEHPTDSPLGVDYSLPQAIATAKREAVLASNAGFSVVIKAQLPNGTWKKIGVVSPQRHLTAHKPLADDE